MSFTDAIKWSLSMLINMVMMGLVVGHPLVLLRDIVLRDIGGLNDYLCSYGSDCQYLIVEITVIIKICKPRNVPL